MYLIENNGESLDKNTANSLKNKNIYWYKNLDSNEIKIIDKEDKNIFGFPMTIFVTIMHSGFGNNHVNKM